MPVAAPPVASLEQLRQEGYVVLPALVPPAQLQALRDHCERMYRRQRVVDG